MIVAQALLFKERFRIVEAADQQVELDKFSFPTWPLAIKRPSSLSDSSAKQERDDESQNAENISSKYSRRALL
jgi:hypothetical protein